MLFTFDLILVDQNFKVVGLRELIRPFRITSPKCVPGVLELPAHTIFKSRTEVAINWRSSATKQRQTETSRKWLNLRPLWCRKKTFEALLGQRLRIQ